MGKSKYTEALPDILATLHGQQNADTSPNQQTDQTTRETEKIHVYPVELEGGVGVLFTKTPIEDTETKNPPTVESDLPASPLPTTRKVPISLLSSFLVLLFFLFLDSAGAILTDLFTPTATVTILPIVRSISVQSTMPLGKLLSPITLSESQTVPTTGHGHQDAKAATGTLTFYNGLFTAQFVAQGTVFTGSDGIQVATDQSVTIPANSPPVDGQATVPAHALNKGQNGNINAGDIDITINNGLLVKNSSFYGGQDARDFKIVTQSDITTTAAILKAKVTASMIAALQEQLTPTQQIQKVPCSPTVTPDHAVGDEATRVQVTVSESCTAIAYDPNALQTRATQLLTTQALRTLGNGYTRYGDIDTTVTKATTNQQTVVLSFVSQGTFTYQLTAKVQERIMTLIAGKPRLTVLHQLTALPGIQHASISGIADNQPLPDVPHIHLLILFPGV